MTSQSNWDKTLGQMGQLGQIKNAHLSQFFLSKSAFQGYKAIKILNWDKWTNEFKENILGQHLAVLRYQKQRT